MTLFAKKFGEKMGEIDKGRERKKVKKQWNRKRNEIK